MICGGSPCQDFSIAGKQKGSYWHCLQCNHEYNPLTVHFSERDKCPMCGCTKLDKTRSSLLVEWLRIVRANKPEWGIYENVKNIVGKQFKATFDMFVSELKEYGYNVYYKVLNAKNYGVPQNRERVYVIIIKKEMDNGKFKFPAPFDNGIRLKDILEDEVDEKYYINNEKAAKLIDELVESGKLDGRERERLSTSQSIIQTQSNEQTASWQDMTAESVTNNKLELVSLSQQGNKIEKVLENAHTLMARDYKGFGNQPMNGVIVNGKWNDN